MPVYHYKGYRNDGGAATGIIDAESPKVARVKLRKVGVFPTDMVEQGSATAGSITGTSGKSSAGIGRSPALSTTDVAMMTRQLATLLVAGLPLVEALGVMVDQTEKKSVKSLMADIREEIRGGASYSAVLERYPREFSQIYVHMVRAGEASGALDQILFRLAEFLEKQLALKHKVTNAVLYPALMLIVGVSVLFFLMTFVVPKITAVFTSLKQALPWPTVVLMSISHFPCRLLGGDSWWSGFDCVGGASGDENGSGAAHGRPMAAEDSTHRRGRPYGRHLAAHEHVGHHVGERCAVVGCHGCREAGDE